MTCKIANEIPLGLVIQTMGYKPIKKHTQGREKWYENPVRTETESSFSVNEGKNVWYDFGTGQGGTVVDLVLEYKKTDVAGALDWLRSNINPITVESITSYQANKVFEPKKPRFEFRSAKKLSNFALVAYLESRNISKEITRHYIKEVRYFDTELKKEFFSLGIKNNQGGYSLRNKYGKTILAPNDIAYFQSASKTKRICVFEGMFDFLSYLMIKNTPEAHDDILILNSLALHKRAKSFIDELGHIEEVILYLDNPKQGNDNSKNAMEMAIGHFKLLKQNVYTANKTYEHFNDLGEYWTSRKDRSPIIKTLLK